MADQDYPTLYEDMEESAQRTRAAAIAFEHVLGGTETELVPVNGYPDQPTIAGRVKAGLDVLVEPVEAAIEAAKRFLGSSAANPTTRADGSPLQEGDSYFNTATKLERMWNGDSWIVPNVDGQQLGGVGGAATIGEASGQNVQQVLDALKAGFSDLGRMASTVAILRATPGMVAGERILLKNYLSGDNKGRRYLTWVPGTVKDDGGMYIGATGGTWYSDLDPDGMIDASFWGLPLASGFNNAEFAAIEAYMFTNKVSCKIGRGIYDNGATKYPWRTGDVASATFRDYRGASLYCTPQTVLRTTSSNGNDVLNLVCLENFALFGFPQIKGTITTEIGSGTNGISVVHGGRNIYIEATCDDLPYIDKGAGAVDGGSATSLQATAASLLPFENVRFRVRAKGVSHGFTCTGPYEYFVDYPTKGCVLDIDVENAYRGAAIGLAAPVEAPATPPHIGITGSVRCKNVQQPLCDFRGDGVQLDVSVMNDLVKESLIFLASNPLVAVAQILGAKNYNYNVHGEIRSADTWLRIGGTTMGGGVIGSTEKGVLRQNVKHNSVTTTIDLVNSGGVDIVNNELYLYGISSGYSGVSARSSSLFVNGQKVHSTVYPGDATASVRSNSYTQVLFTDPLTAVRAVPLPTPANIGDVVFTARLASATGVGAMQVLGVNYAVSTWAEFTYSGSAWVRTKTGAV